MYSLLCRRCYQQRLNHLLSTTTVAISNEPCLWRIVKFNEVKNLVSNNRSIDRIKQQRQQIHSTLRTCFQLVGSMCGAVTFRAEGESCPTSHHNNLEAVTDYALLLEKKHQKMQKHVLQTYKTFRLVWS